MLYLFASVGSFFSSNPGEFVRVSNDTNRLNLVVLHLHSQNGPGSTQSAQIAHDYLGTQLTEGLSLLRLTDENAHSVWLLVRLGFTERLPTSLPWIGVCTPVARALVPQDRSLFPCVMPGKEALLSRDGVFS